MTRFFVHQQDQAVPVDHRLECGRMISVSAPGVFILATTGGEASTTCSPKRKPWLPRTRIRVDTMLIYTGLGDKDRALAPAARRSACPDFNPTPFPGREEGDEKCEARSWPGLRTSLVLLSCLRSAWVANRQPGLPFNRRRLWSRLWSRQRLHSRPWNTP